MPHLWEKNEGVYCMSKDIERPEYKVLTGPVSLFETMAYTANRNFTDQAGCSFGEESEKPFLIAAKKYLQQVYADSECTILELCTHCRHILVEGIFWQQLRRAFHSLHQKSSQLDP